MGRAGQCEGGGGEVRSCAHHRLPPIVAGGLEQLRAATLLNQVCGERKCSMIVNTADNFYVK